MAEPLLQLLLSLLHLKSFVQYHLRLSRRQGRMHLPGRWMFVHVLSQKSFVRYRFKRVQALSRSVFSIGEVKLMVVQEGQNLDRGNQNHLQLNQMLIKQVAV